MITAKLLQASGGGLSIEQPAVKPETHGHPLHVDAPDGHADADL